MKVTTPLLLDLWGRGIEMDQATTCTVMYMTQFSVIIIVQYLQLEHWIC